MSKFNVSQGYVKSREKGEAIKRRNKDKKRKAKKGKERAEAERKYRGLEL